MPDEDDWRLLRDDLKQRPRNRTPSEVTRLLEAGGFEGSPGKGSHTNYRKEGYPLVVTIPRRKTLPLGYVKQAIRAVEDSQDDT